MAGIDRREFLLRELPREFGKLWFEWEQCFDEDNREDFFSSYNSSYSISLAYPKKMLIDTAKRLGITTKGKSRLQLAKEIFASKAPGEHGGNKKQGS
jgi:hypothetical protein